MSDHHFENAPEKFEAKCICGCGVSISVYRAYGGDISVVMRKRLGVSMVDAVLPRADVRTMRNYLTSVLEATDGVDDE